MHYNNLYRTWVHLWLFSTSQCTCPAPQWFVILTGLWRVYLLIAAVQTLSCTDRFAVSCRISIIYGSFAFRAATTGEFFLQIAWLWAAAGRQQRLFLPCTELRILDQLSLTNVMLLGPCNWVHARLCRSNHSHRSSFRFTLFEGFIPM